MPISLEKNLKKINEGYFIPLIEEAKDLVDYDITNICIDEKYRRTGLGEKLLRYVLDEYANKDIHLDLIASNIPALKLYEKCGFLIVSEYEGFSGQEKPVSCYHMVKRG